MKENSSSNNIPASELVKPEDIREADALLDDGLLAAIVALLWPDEGLPN